MEIKGEKIRLVPITPDDKDEFFEMATKSHGAAFWYDNEQAEKRSKEAFFKDWEDKYFDTASPEKGQCLWIVLDGEKIGQIAYGEIDKRRKKAEIDIIIGDEKYMGEGYGPDALSTLNHYLFEKLGVNKIWLNARANNLRAVAAYEKAGFKVEGILKEDDYFEGEFVDIVRFGLLKKDGENL